MQSGNTLYVTEQTDHSIRTVHTTTARVGTIVPGGVAGGYRDGPGASARFNYPRGAAAAGSTLYVADNLNHRIRAIDLASKTVSTLAGSGTAGHRDDTAGTAAQFNRPTGLALSGTTLYVADYNNHRIRAIDLASGTVRDIAGDGTAGNKNGIGAAAQVTFPLGIAVSGDTLYVTSDNLIRKLEYR